MKTVEKANYSMFCYGSIGKLGVYLIRRYFSPLKYKVELTSTTKLLELVKLKSIASRAKFTKIFPRTKERCIPKLGHPLFKKDLSDRVETWHAYTTGVSSTFDSEHPTPYLPPVPGYWHRK